MVQGLHRGFLLAPLQEDTGSSAIYFPGRWAQSLDFRLGFSIRKPQLMVLGPWQMGEDSLNASNGGVPIEESPRFPSGGTRGRAAPVIKKRQYVCDIPCVY